MVLPVHWQMLFWKLYTIRTKSIHLGKYQKIQTKLGIFIFVYSCLWYLVKSYPNNLIKIKLCFKKFHEYRNLTQKIFIINGLFTSVLMILNWKITMQVAPWTHWVVPCWQWPPTFAWYWQTPFTITCPVRHCWFVPLLFPPPHAAEIYFILKSLESDGSNIGWEWVNKIVVHYLHLPD